MTRDSKDRQSWRTIPSHAVEEARRRAGLDKAEAREPKTRSSWMPSFKLPGVRREAKNVEGVASSNAAGQHNFQGGSTLPWQPTQPNQPNQPDTAPAPVVRSNMIVDPDYLSSASGGRAGAAAHGAAAKSSIGMTSSERVPSSPMIVSGGPRPANSLSSPLSVREALATIDAAAAQRSARLHKVPMPAPSSKSGEVHREAALGAIDAALERANGSPPPAAARFEPPQAAARSAQLHAMRTPSLTAAPGSAAASKPAPVIQIAGPVTSAQQPMAAAAPPDIESAKPNPPPREQVFRANALRAKSEEPVAQPLPEVTGSGWSVLLVLSTLLMIGLGLAYVGRVEQTSIASGVLQVSGGPRPVLSQTSGPVLSLEVRPGDSVQQGQTLARVDATELKAREQRDVAQLAQAKLEKERISAAELARLQSDQRGLRQKRTLLEERARLKTEAVRDRRERMEQVQHAAHEGVATQGDALAVREAERAASEELLLIRQQITDIDLQLGEAQKNYQSTLERLRHDIDSAANSLAETRMLLQTTEIHAPVAGRVESLQVAQGQVIGTGTVLARIVPDGTVSNAVVFAPAKDASFLREGLDASLEFASLPVSEFGKAAARVSRVSKDVASNDEIYSALGRSLEEPVIRVELELLPSEQLTRVQDKLRSGERLTARLNTRDRRMITLLFDFLRKWYEP